MQPLQIENDNIYVEVAVSLPVFGSYHYAVDPTLGTDHLTGKRVLVPFGQRRVTGYVLGPTKVPAIEEIKLILDVLDESPLFPATMIPFFRWIADYYIHPIGEVIKCALPGGLNYRDFLMISLTTEGSNALTSNQASLLESMILKHLNTKPTSLKSLYKYTKSEFPTALIHRMEARGWLKTYREIIVGRTKPKTETYVSLLDPLIPLHPQAAAKLQILNILDHTGEISVRDLKDKIPTASRHLKSLEMTGHVTISQKSVYRDPFGEPICPDQAHVLTKEQSRVMERIDLSAKRGFKPYLLTGVTGSGKTEIYLQLAEKAINLGYSVLVLVPEIALISQMERRFRARFGECVALLHSGLSAGERYDQWMRIIQGEVVIAVGARSAIFAPLKNIGLIIVDEEHDTSYKQEGHLRYNARDLAVVRAQFENSIVLMGSATPSIQSYYNVKTKKYHGVTLTRRVEQRPLPDIHLVDLRKNRDKRGIGRFITSELHIAIEKTLARKEQVLLFLNRRGFAGYPVCSSCGNVIHCKYCDISLTLHQSTHAFKCHYCGYSLPSASPCPSCGSLKIKSLGLGTEKVEEAIKALFPQANVIRMDRDTTIRKGSILSILKSLRNGTIDILIGTQMVAKGHDFPNITLVGIICADLSLNFPDFRSAERTFQLLAQVSGRTGRGEVPGRVILQTYNPDHFSIVSAKNQDMESFFQEEIGFRKTLNYPPFSRMVMLKISGKDRKKTIHHVHMLGDLCNAIKGKEETFKRNITVMGPIEAPLPRIANQFRWQILLKGSPARTLQRFVKILLFENPHLLNYRSVNLTVDVDPFHMM